MSRKPSEPGPTRRAARGTGVPASEELPPFNNEAVSERIRQIFLDQLHLELPGDDVDLIESGVLDSFLLVELLLSIEQVFGVTIPLGSIEIDSFRSIRRIAGFLAGLTPMPSTGVPELSVSITFSARVAESRG